MRVLWFSNTPANADEYFDERLKGTGGWMKSLDLNLQEKVELHVAFYSNRQIKSFKYLNSHYYPIFSSGSKLINKIRNKFSTRIVLDEDVNKYLDIINAVRPDIIHVHGTELPFGFVCGKTQIPVVISIQGNITVYHHKYFSGIEKSLLPQDLPLLEYFSRTGVFTKQYHRFSKWTRAEQQILKRCHNIIGRTNWDYRITRVFAPNSNYFYVSEILRQSFYKEYHRVCDKNKFVIFTTNGNNLYKGFETLCSALYLLNNVIQSEIEWRVAGISFTDPIVEVVRKKLKDKFPKSNLVLLGSLDEIALIQNLLETNLYVMTSHIENSPNNLSEAMILGLPCIATYVGGTGSLLVDNVSGVLIQSSDPFVLAGAILDLKSDHLRMELFGRNARLEALKRHNPVTVVNDLLDTYKKIIKNTA